jgi:hypothetical protein
MDKVQDSDVVNFANSVGALYRKVTAPKKRGVRPIGGQEELTLSLWQDMVGLLTSPLSQRGSRSLQPVPGLGPDQIEALRALHARVKDGPPRDEVLGAAVEKAVELLNPSFTSEVAKERDGKSDSMIGKSK